MNGAGADGLFCGNPRQFLIQLLATAIAVVFAFMVTYVLARILDKVMGLRVTASEEEVGLDVSEHGERAFA